MLLLPTHIPISPAEECSTSWIPLRFPCSSLQNRMRIGLISLFRSLVPISGSHLLVIDYLQILSEFLPNFPLTDG